MWARLWTAWALAGVTLEVAALTHERVPGDTLTQNLQHALGCRAPRRRLRFAGYLVFLAWLTDHLWKVEEPYAARLLAGGTQLARTCRPARRK